jgi:alpha-beta hydrolase superfamily lysophospholipase
VRTLSTPAITQMARLNPKAPLPNIDPGFSTRAIRDAGGPGQAYDERWRPTPVFPVRAGWLHAIIAGHARVAQGLDIDVPVFAAWSARSIASPWWSDDMRHADVVIDVEAAAARAAQLGSIVTVVRIAGGLHDLVLSAPAARAQLYAELDRWLAGYGWG